MSEIFDFEEKLKIDCLFAEKVIIQTNLLIGANPNTYLQDKADGVQYNSEELKGWIYDRQSDKLLDKECDNRFSWTTTVPQYFSTIFYHIKNWNLLLEEEDPNPKVELLKGDLYVAAVWEKKTAVIIGSKETNFAELWEEIKNGTFNFNRFPAVS